jgi:hypothetical protein
MSKESRSVFLAGLTLVTFALIGYFKDGGIVFPFPLNEFIFFFVIVQFTFWHYKKGILPVIFLLSAILGIASNLFMWEIFLSPESLDSFIRYPWVHWFYLLFIIGLVTASILHIAKQRQLLAIAIHVAGTCAIGYGMYFGETHIKTIGFGAIVLSTQIQPVHKPFHLLWILLLILSASESLTYLLS